MRGKGDADRWSRSAGAEPHMAVVDDNVDRKKIREAAEAPECQSFLDNLAAGFLNGSWDDPHPAREAMVGSLMRPCEARTRASTMAITAGFRSEPGCPGESFGPSADTAFSGVELGLQYHPVAAIASADAQSRI